MKVLIFLTNIDQDKGGPSRSVPLFVRGLSDIGVNMTLMVIRSENMNLHMLDGTSAKIHYISASYRRKDLEKFVEAEKFDIIHGQCLWEPLFHMMRKIADRFNIPFILSPRGTLEPWSLGQKRIKKKLAMLLYQRHDLNRCACIYTTATMEAQHIKELGFNRPMCIIPNGIDTSNYPCRESYSEVKKQVLFLSRIHPKKGVELLINAWREVYPGHNDWRLVIVGNGESAYIGLLKKKIEDMGLTGCVDFFGPVYGQNKVSLYHSSSLFVLPSFSENFGMVIAEALSCGVPVITTDKTPWYLLNETHSGWCIPLSLEDLVKVLGAAMRQPLDSLYNMGQRGSRMVNDYFSYQKCAIKNKALYEWILYGGNEPEFMYKG